MNLPIFGLIFCLGGLILGIGFCLGIIALMLKD